MSEQASKESRWHAQWSKGDLPSQLDNVRKLLVCPFCGEKRKHLTKTGNSAEFKCGTSLTRYMANSRHLQSVSCCQRERVAMEDEISALARQLAERGWRPISEYTPEMGKILAFDAESGVHEASQWNENLWIAKKGRGDVFGLYQVTHFQSRPPAPEGKEGVR